MKTEKEKYINKLDDKLNSLKDVDLKDKISKDIKDKQKEVIRK